MKAIFGKLSILCGIVVLISLYLLARKNVEGFVIGFYAMAFGLPFGFLSVFRPETPRWYGYIGFLLNLIPILLFGALMCRETLVRQFY